MLVRVQAVQLPKRVRISLQHGRPGFSTQGGKIPQEEETATRSRILAWRLPWTEEPGGLYSPWGPKESDTTERLTLSPFARKKRLTALRQTGIRDTSLGRLHPDRGLSQQQNTKKAHGAEDSCTQTQSGQIPGKRHGEVPTATPQEPKAKAGCWGLP